MSLASWKKEFYTAASKVAKEDAVEHSLKKWKGLRNDNLEKHGCAATIDGNIRSYKTHAEFKVNANSCALCRHHIKEYMCGDCPIKASRGATCDRYLPNSKKATPWNCWTDYSDPEPMIKALKKAKKFEEQQALK